MAKNKPIQLPELPEARISTEQANTPAFRQLSLTLALFPDIATSSKLQQFLELTEENLNGIPNPPA